MNRDIPINRAAVNITLFLLLLPFYATVLLTREFGALTLLLDLIAEGRPFAFPLVYLLLLGYAASALWLLWRGHLLGPALVLLVTVVMHSASSGAHDAKRYELLIGSSKPVRGIDVYCNGVHLGRTPLRISERQLRSKVDPWDTPPEQPRFSISGDQTSDSRYHFARYYYVPYEVFALYKAWPPSLRYNRHNDKEMLEDIKSSKYWWHFEKDGCVGLTRLANFAGGSGGGLTITINIDPDIEFLSAAAHLQLMLAHLESTACQPTEEWLRHFLKFKGLLFMQFYEHVLRDDRLRPALDALVRAEFDIPDKPAARDCARVLDQILDSVERAGVFTVPSLESLAVTLVGRAHAEPLTERFLESLRLGPSASSGQYTSDIWTTYRRSGINIRQIPLQLAVRQLCPPELFNRLVYMSRNGSYLDIVGSYPRKETVRLIQYHLRAVEQRTGRRRRFDIRRAMRFCAQIKNPELEPFLYDFIRRNSASRGSDFHIRRFIESRITDAGSANLPEWIFHWAPLEDREKIDYLVRVNDPRTSYYMKILIHRNCDRRQEVIYQLEKNPNPSLDQFLIDSYRWYLGPQGPGHWPTYLTGAIANADTPAIRQFLTSLWNEAGDRNTLLKNLQRAQWRSPHMSYLTPLIEQLTDTTERLAAVKLLEKIDSTGAWDLAAKWARDADPQLAAAAAEQLQIHQQRTDEQKSRLQQAGDLIAGKIKPDDLLAPPRPYHWNGQQYTPKPANTP